MPDGSYLQYEQIGIRCAIYRGGTSKGVIFHEHDLPPAGPTRDAVLKRVMGTPDIMQIDGLGGTHLITSKIVIVGPPTRADADVDYTFVQAEIERDALDYSRSCGNMSAAVGPFAIDAGLMRATEPVTRVRIHATNTGKIVTAHVPVRHGRARVMGDFAIAGVPGTGAEIIMDYSLTAGSRTGRMLPTGKPRDRITLDDGCILDVSICDVACTCVFVRAEDLGMQGNELPEAIHGSPALLARMIELRGRAAQLLGLAGQWQKADDESPSSPFLVVVSKSLDYQSLEGESVSGADMDLCARFMYLNRCHTAMAGTGSMCMAAASRIPGSLVEAVVVDSRKQTLDIGHPSGIMQVHVVAREAGNDSGVSFDTLGFGRTARKIMEGTVYIPDSGIYGGSHD